MTRITLALSVLCLSAAGQLPVGGGNNNGGGGGSGTSTAAPPYTQPFSAVTTVTALASVHGAGTNAIPGFCWDNATPQAAIALTAGYPQRAANGDITWAWTGSKTGNCYVWQASASGTASGDLSGTYPAPAVASVGGASAASIASHLGNTSNPHAVTAAQAGAIATGNAYSDLSTASKIGTGAAQVAAGNHAHAGTYVPVGGAFVDIGAARIQGNGAKIQMASGTPTAGVCVEYDSNGNAVPAVSGLPCGSGGGGSGTVVGGTSGKIAVNTVSGTTTVDVVAGTIGGITDANNWSGLNTFSQLIAPVVSSLVTTDCDEAAEIGRVAILTSAATGNKWHVCEQLTSGPATYGWRSQGGSGVSDGDKGDVTVSSSGTVWTVDTLPSSRVGLGNVSNYLPCTLAQAIAGSVSTCYMTPDVAAAAVSAATTADQFQDGVSQYGDEFISGTGSTTTIGQLGWSLTTNGSATTPTYANGDRNHPGIFRIGLTSAAISGAEQVLWLGPTASSPHYSGLQTTAGWEFRFRVRIQTSAQSALTEAGTQYWVGLGSMSGTISASVTPTDGFFAHFTSGANGPWNLETLKAGSADAAAQASTAGNLALGTWYTVRIRSVAGSDGTVLISINAGSGFETEKSFAVTSTAALTPMVIVQSTATTASLPRNIDIDSYRVVESVSRY